VRHTIVFEWSNMRPLTAVKADIISLIEVASLQSADANRAVWP